MHGAVTEGNDVFADIFGPESGARAALLRVGGVAEWEHGVRQLEARNEQGVEAV